MTISPNEPFDDGLQLERTELAWRRTALSVAVVSIGGIRVLGDILGPLAVVLGIVGLVIAGAIGWRASRRYRAHHARLTTHGEEAGLQGAGLQALTAFSLTIISATCLIAIIAHHLGN